MFFYVFTDTALSPPTENTFRPLIGQHRSHGQFPGLSLIQMRSCSTIEQPRVRPFNIERPWARGFNIEQPWVQLFNQMIANTEA